MESLSAPIRFGNRILINRGIAIAITIAIATATEKR